MPLVTAITVFYNREAHVAQSVESLLAQDYPNLEILLVDDGSKDGTLDALQAYESDLRVSVISGRNQGLVGALRAAIAQAQGSLIAIHGSGDISLPNRLSRQVEALGRAPCWPTAI